MWNRLRDNWKERKLCNHHADKHTHTFTHKNRHADRPLSILGIRHLWNCIFEAFIKQREKCYITKRKTNKNIENMMNKMNKFILTSSVDISNFNEIFRFSNWLLFFAASTRDSIEPKNLVLVKASSAFCWTFLWIFRYCRILWLM